MTIQQKIESAIEEINSKYSTGHIVKASSLPPLARISTGSISLDILCGIDSEEVGGMPKGRMVMLSGPFSSCKSTIAKKIIKHYQDVDPHRYAYVVLTEGDFNKDWDAALGLDLSKIYIDRPENVNPAIDNAIALAKKGLLNVLIVDTISAGATRKTLERKQDEGQQVGGDAQDWNMGIRKFHSTLNTRIPVVDELGNVVTDRKNGKPILKDNDMIIILISQERLKPSATFLTKTRPGGLGKEFASSITVELQSTEEVNVSLKTGELVEGRTEDAEVFNVGERITFKVTKNKTAGTARDRGSFLFFTKYWKDYKPGMIDNYEEFLRYGLMVGMFEKAGSWFSNGETKTQGEENFKAFLKTRYEQEDLFKIIIPKVREFFQKNKAEEVEDACKEEECEAGEEGGKRVRRKKTSEQRSDNV